ncbi:4Fe-4S dicluster domain-containing protein [Microvirga sp. TS319]|uniref:4Fe-4S dicluster domain-containing protein n=1 Tax=Microvirga sp. TS319 TaxID=3241165 RepID=UPI00351A2A98
MPPLNAVPDAHPNIAPPGDTETRAFSRRDALKILAAQITLALGACSKPDEEILPYVRMPERLIPGEPLRFATTLPLGGYGRGVVCISIDGRPIKVEGNPLHPASLGSTDVFAEAAIFGLYDPARSRTVLQHGSIASWEMFLQALLPQIDHHRVHGGNGLRLLTGRVTSPTLLRQIDLVLKRYPGARWHSYEPIGDESERAGTALAFGRPLQPLPRIEEARAILCLDADPLGPGPGQIQHARSWIGGRRPFHGPNPSRLYVVEAVPTPTGAKADQRLMLHPGLIHNAAIAVANALGAGLPGPDLSASASRFIGAAAQDLLAHRERALVLAGRTLPPETHALVHWINAELGAKVEFVEPVDTLSGTPELLQVLTQDLDQGRVRTLVVIGANPAYDTPAEFGLQEMLTKVPFSVHCGPYADETASVCRWHIPESHPLESWSDLRAIDGTASLVQPLIRPLYATHTAHELLASLLGRSEARSYELVRETWSATGVADFEAWWRQALHDGVLAGSAANPVAVTKPPLPAIVPVTAPDLPTIVLRPDDCLWDGRFASNAWLQECPKPLTKQVWGNALALGPADAEKLGLVTGDVVRIDAGARSVTGPVLVEPGHAPGVASLTLGYGRRQAGQIGTAVGTNAYELRTSRTPWLVEGVHLTKSGDRQEILNTQNYVRLQGEAQDLYPVLLQANLAQGGTVGQDAGAQPSLYPPQPYAGYAWGMVIDAAACIGCNACVVACQAENNVPVVGPEEIAQGRDMHWLRIDVYDHGTPERPKPGFQPVPCMHCELAPCEPVCPVAASVHDSEGLNAQIYNRCVGTRFCEANCPYKVRRFNFFAYADGQEYGNLGAESIKAQRNPNVTVRTRGVMEKCTYCVQRISRARQAAETQNRSIAEGEVVTACQAACPTRAITFGNLNDGKSGARTAKSDPRHYALLGTLGTRPRTTYLADVKNPNPAIDGDAT